jgi:hypothetical protein
MGYNDAQLNIQIHNEWQYREIWKATNKSQIVVQHSPLTRKKNHDNSPSVRLFLRSRFEMDTHRMQMNVVISTTPRGSVIGHRKDSFC